MLGIAALSSAVAVGARVGRCRRSARIARSITSLRWDFSPAEIETTTQEIIDKTRAVDARVAETDLSTATFATAVQPLIDLETTTSGLVHNLTTLKDLSPDSDVRDASRAASEALSALDVERQMNVGVYRVLKHVLETEAGLGGEPLRYLEHSVRDYERNGLHLPEGTRAEVEAAKKEMSQLKIAFMANLAKDATEVLVAPEELDGMAEAFVSSLEAREGKLVVTMKYPHVMPIMDRCSNADTRRRVATAFASRCMDTNVPLLEKLIKLRARVAKLLGFPTHADYRARVTMAKSSTAVTDFLTGLRDRLRPAAERERAALLAIKAAEARAQGEPAPDRIEAWDLRYLQERAKAAEFAVDSSEVQQYFPLDRVVDGMLAVYGQVLGLTFEPVAAPHAWHEEVSMFAVSDADTGAAVGHFYLDLHPRDGKYGHACCMNLQPGCTLPDGTRQQPVCALIGNFTRPTATQPSLLEHGEVETLFHEFGHGMHYLCARAELPAHGAFGVEWDFVETPSQMMENWCFEEAPLRRMSSHVATGAPIPATMIANLKRAKHANVAMLTMRQLSFGLFDQAIHSADEADTAAVFARVSTECTGIEPIPGTNFAGSFGHMAGGYDALYYGYMWSLVYAEDVYQTCFAADCMDRATGMRYRRAVLEPGGKRDAMESMREILNREPNDTAFLRSRNLI